MRCDLPHTYSIQGFTYSQKSHSKCGFLNLVNAKTSQFMFPKYLIEYQNVKIMKLKFKVRKVPKTNIKAV